MTAPRSIETTRLSLAPLAAADGDAFHALMIDTDVRRYLCDGQIMPREWADGVIARSVADFAAHGWGLFGIRLNTGPKLIGVVGFNEFWEPPELQILWALHPDHWGRGLATEASRAVITDAFERLGFARVMAATDPPNVASIAVMRRLGLGLVEQALRNGKPALIYAIDRGEWRP